jgi:hypothetical protein
MPFNDINGCVVARVPAVVRQVPSQRAADFCVVLLRHRSLFMITQPIPKPHLGQLLEHLLSDTATDVEVVTRELGLRDEMRERLRRTLDRIDCAQRVLDALESRMRTGTASALDGLRVKAAMDLLARRWPLVQCYVAGSR